MPDTELALLFDRFMRHVHFALQEKADGFDTENVGPGGGIVLLTLAEMGCTGINDLTQRVARDKSQMTRMIRSLERKGLVDRKPSPDDARVSLVSLTPKGDAFVETLRQAVAVAINGLLEPVSADERALLTTLMKRIIFPGQGNLPDR
jgi:DNA-binding MarR family transcriptional regulator